MNTRTVVAFSLGALTTPLAYELTLRLLGRSSIDPAYRRKP